MRQLQLGMAVAGLSVMAAAQTDRGVITGTAQDPAGVVVAGVAVSAQNSDTGAVFPTSTTATGNFTITAVPAGVYQIAVEAAGFWPKPFVLASLYQVGSVAESVTVTAERNGRRVPASGSALAVIRLR